MKKLFVVMVALVAIMSGCAVKEEPYRAEFTTQAILNYKENGENFAEIQYFLNLSSSEM